MKNLSSERLQRYLHGPGPSPVAPSVLEALAMPVVGHLDPAFLSIMDEVTTDLRWLFRTKNQLTFPISGTGSAGMEAAVFNLIEPGDTIVVGVNGLFGGRIAEEASRAGANVVAVEAPWGQAIPTKRVGDAVQEHRPKVVAIVHAETSTGVLQPIEELRPAIGPDPLLLVDAVTSLGGSPLEIDGWGIDACYSGTQKCLSVPPGLAPVTFSQRAVETVLSRSTPVQSWYLDVSLLGAFWDDETPSRAYHHTAPISMIYALHEGLRLAREEGLQTRWDRHERIGRALQAGLENRGWELLPPREVRLPQLSSVVVPHGLDDASSRRRLLERDQIEVGGGLGPLAGKIWRLGMMGHGATDEALDRLLNAIDDLD